MRRYLLMYFQSFSILKKLLGSNLFFRSWSFKFSSNQSVGSIFIEGDKYASRHKQEVLSYWKTSKNLTRKLVQMEHFFKFPNAEDLDRERRKVATPFTSRKWHVVQYSKVSILRWVQCLVDNLSEMFLFCEMTLKKITVLLLMLPWLLRKFI